MDVMHGTRSWHRPRTGPRGVGALLLCCAPLLLGPAHAGEQLFAVAHTAALAGGRVSAALDGVAPGENGDAFAIDSRLQWTRRWNNGIRADVALSGLGAELRSVADGTAMQPPAAGRLPVTTARLSWSDARHRIGIGRQRLPFPGVGALALPGVPSGDLLYDAVDVATQAFDATRLRYAHVTGIVAASPGASVRQPASGSLFEIDGAPTARTHWSAFAHRIALTFSRARSAAWGVQGSTELHVGHARIPLRASSARTIVRGLRYGDGTAEWTDVEAALGSSGFRVVAARGRYAGRAAEWGLTEALRGFRADLPVPCDCIAGTERALLLKLERSALLWTAGRQTYDPARGSRRTRWVVSGSRAFRSGLQLTLSAARGSTTSGGTRPRAEWSIGLIFRP